MASARSEKTLTREDWLAAALDALAESGADALKVLPLARRLGVSRGSFYWHSRDRAELLDAALDHWDRWSTQVVIDTLDASRDDPERKLLALMEMVTERRLTRYESAVRAWAERDPAAARVVRRVDRRRLAYVTDLFRKVGFSRDESDARARLFAVYVSADPIFYAKEPAARGRQLLRCRWKVLVSRA